MHYRGKTTPADLQRQTKNAKFEMFKALNEAHRLRKENERLREALRFYANEESWEPSIDMPFEKDDYCSEVDLDKGRIASEALQGDSND